MLSFLYYCQDAYRTWLCIWVTRRVSYKKQELLILRQHLSSPPILVGSVLLFFVVFVLSYYIYLRSDFLVLMSFTISALKRSLYLQLFVGGFMSYLGYLCFFAYRVVQHILRVFLLLLFFILCTLCCHFLWIVHLYCPIGII